MKQVKKLVTGQLPAIFLLPAILWQVIFLCIPLVIILYFSFTRGNAQGLIFTLSNYFDLFEVVYLKIIIRSLLLSVSTALSCLCIAYPVAYFLALYVRRFKGLLLFLLMLPFWTNFLVQVYAWYFLLERNGLINSILKNIGLITEPIYMANSIFAVYVVMVYCYFPFMIMPLYSILDKFNVVLLEASFDLGATPWQTFRRITIPLSMPGIKTGFLLVLIPAFGEFAIPALLGGGKSMMIGSLISYYFLNVRDNNLGSAFTCLSGLILILIVLIFQISISKATEKTHGGRVS